MEEARSLRAILKDNASLFGKVVPFDAREEKLVRLHFTEMNQDLTEEILSNTQLFTAYINKTLDTAGARYGIGGYDEHRTIYKRSQVFDGGGLDEPRRLHLGIDIWGKPNTPVLAPLDGMVHSFAFNQAFGDYGATIILCHWLEGVAFHTLYGHLSLASIRNLREGERIKKGDVFAEFGIPQENGSWPPHLHFQVVQDMEGMKGDYPGVCRLSERGHYLANCPDPDLILNLMQYVD